MSIGHWALGKIIILLLPSHASSLNRGRLRTRLAPQSPIPNLSTYFKATLMLATETSLFAGSTAT